LRARPSANACWAVYIEALTQGGRPQLGLAIPKKLAKRAVDRNKLKRLSRELARKRIFGSNSDCVIKLRQSVGKKTQGRLRKQEQTTLRAKLMELANAAG